MKSILPKLSKWLFPNAIPVYNRLPMLVSNSNNGSSIGNLVVILGWGGSVRKNFDKIQEFYLQKGYTTIVCTMPIMIPSVIRYYLIDCIASAINQHFVNVHELQSNNTKLYYHVFSNNGSWAYADLTEQANNSIKVKQPDKVIFDSAAYLPTEHNSVIEESYLLSRPFVAMILKRPQYDHWFITRVLTICFLPVVILQQYCSKYYGSSILPDIYSLHSYLKYKHSIPSLFVYSTGDQLVSVSMVEDFISHQQIRNIPVSLWEIMDINVPHTSSYFKYTEEYQSKIMKYFD